MSEPLAYLNGEFIPASEARLPVSDAGVVQGATVSELTRTFGGRLFRFDDHLARLFRSLEAVGIECPLSPDAWRDIADRLVGHNAPLLPAGSDLGLIQFVTAGPYPTYSGVPAAQRAPTVCAHTFVLPLATWAEKMQHGVHLVTPAVRQVPAQSLDPQVKCRSRMHYFLADQQARRVDPAAMALLLDVDGNVTETGAANLLIVERGALVSPPESTILPGVSRRNIAELADKLEVAFAERLLRPECVANADEVLLTSTPYCLLPVTRFNGRAIGDGRPGPMFARFLEAWSRQVGVDIRAQIVGNLARG